MKIVGIPLNTINYGDTFVFGGSYYMKCQLKLGVNQIIPDNYITENMSVVVDLAEGKLIWIPSDTLVPPIYSRIRINGRAD